MFLSFLHPNSLSKKMMRVVFSIYFGVAFLVTGIQFVTEYIKTQDSILNELRELGETVQGPIATSLWQYNKKQLDSLTTGLVKMPIIEGVDVLDYNSENILSKRSYKENSEPISVFDTKSDLYWTLNDKEIFLGSIILYSSSEVVLDRVLFGFSLIAITAIIKLSVLFWLFVWAFNRYLAFPLNELMSQVNAVQLNHNKIKRINLPDVDDNELRQLQKHMNNMFSSMERDRDLLLEDEHSKQAWLEDAVAKRTAALKISNEKLKAMATTDSLTGALSRGVFFETAQNLFLLSQRQKSVLSFILIDLDNFKKINDTYGHSVGDEVLIHFIGTIKSLLRKTDLVGRVGGEEFAICLPDTGLDDATRLAEKIRMTVSESALEVEGKTVTYTVSIGVDFSEPNDDSIDNLFKRSDIKLYSAKFKGRDRVEN